MLRIAAAKPSGTLKPDAPGKQTRRPHNEALINDAIELLINPKQPGATWAAVTLRLGMSADERSRQSGAGSLRRDYDWLASALRKELDKQEIEPANRAKVLLNLGVVFRVTSNWAASDSSLAEAMLNLPADSQVPAMMQRADVLTRLNRHEEALKLARDASRLAPTDFNLRWMVAKKTVLAGRREDALAQYNVLLETPGLDGSARQRLTTERDSLVAAEGRK
jgi:tetratricopeptide (TPR) repeat protein